MQRLRAASEKRTSGHFYFGESTIKNENQHSQKCMLQILILTTFHSFSNHGNNLNVQTQKYGHINDGLSPAESSLYFYLPWEH